MATITGTPGNDFLTGTSPDPFTGSGGDDVISGLAGDDVIDGLLGLNMLDGGPGDDVFRFTGSADRSFFGPPYSRIIGGDGVDTLDLSGYNSRIVITPITAAEAGQLGGVAGDLRVSGTNPNVLASGIERVIGSATVGTTMTFALPIVVTGGSDVDNFTLQGGGITYGMDGNDAISVGAAGTGYGGNGDDRLELTGPGTLYGEAGNDTVALNTLTRGGIVDGGSGTDTIRFGYGDIVDLAAGTLIRPSIDGSLATLVNFENAVLDPNGSGSVTTVFGTAGANVMSFTTVFAFPEYGAKFYGRDGDDVLIGSGGFDVLDGGEGNDVLEGRGGNNQLIGGGGIDTAVIYGFFEQSSFVFAGDHVDVVSTAPPGGRFDVYTGTRGIDRLVGIERVKFADNAVLGDGLVIDRADGMPLVDDLFYYASYRDVAASRRDADAHYAEYGWQEGRAPNALFDTSAYLDANRDVAATRTNPIDHYILFGAREGRDPSAMFDSEQYLARNADVAASGSNPLAHYLAYGQAEGRMIYAAVGKQLTGDFDAEYYLLTNPDVAAAGADALLHYREYGWKEGRDPDAYFDTSYYLANNRDVAAAGVNPLDHYMQYGWREGRDPSAQFDTSYYLEKSPDVAAAGTDPLQHYLEAGRLEGRVIADLSGLEFAWAGFRTTLFIGDGLFS